MFSKYDEIRARRARGDKGFTLIELLVVVVIIGILIAIAIPVYLNYQKGSHDKATGSDVRNAAVTIENCYSSTATYPATAVTWTAATAPCTGQTINVSDGTSITYTPVGTTGYKLDGSNTKGSGDHFCYNSTTGGTITQQATACA